MFEVIILRPVFRQLTGTNGKGCVLKLTDLETKVMKIVWNLSGKATVNEILERWEDAKIPKYTTVLKILQILEEKGVVRHKKKGKAYVYVAKVSRADSLRNHLKKVTNDFFGGKRVLFASNLISESEFSPDELREIKRAIAQKEKELGNE